MFVTAQRAAEAIRQSGLRVEGVNLFLADGEAPGHEVFHVHFHVLPRFQGDGFGLELPAGYGRMADRTNLDAKAASIKSAFKA